MSKQNTGGPAFPCMPPQDTAAGVATGYPFPDSGMTLRDYFAAKALAGYIASYAGTDADPFGPHIQSTAQRCYKMADAMLEEREK